MTRARGTDRWTLNIGARETVHFNSDDLERGNPEEMALFGSGCRGRYVATRAPQRSRHLDAGLHPPFRWLPDQRARPGRRLRWRLSGSLPESGKQPSPSESPATRQSPWGSDERVGPRRGRQRVEFACGRGHDPAAGEHGRGDPPRRCRERRGGSDLRQPPAAWRRSTSTAIGAGTWCVPGGLPAIAVNSLARRASAGALHEPVQGPAMTARKLAITPRKARANATATPRTLHLVCSDLISPLNSASCLSTCANRSSTWARIRSNPRSRSLRTATCWPSRVPSVLAPPSACSRLIPAPCSASATRSVSITGCAIGFGVLSSRQPFA